MFKNGDCHGFYKTSRNKIGVIKQDPNMMNSAGETFVMSLLGRKPTISLIGEPTQGVFSDVLTRRLPNGWSFGLPNEIYLTEGGKVFDGAGVPPSISVPVFPGEDFQNKHDTALEKALQVLSVSGN